MEIEEFLNIYDLSEHDESVYTLKSGLKIHICNDDIEYEFIVTRYEQFKDILELINSLNIRKFNYILGMNIENTDNSHELLNDKIELFPNRLYYMPPPTPIVAKNLIITLLIGRTIYSVRCLNVGLLYFMIKNYDKRFPVIIDDLRLDDIYDCRLRGIFDSDYGHPIIIYNICIKDNRAAEDFIESLISWGDVLVIIFNTPRGYGLYYRNGEKKHIIHYYELLLEIGKIVADNEIKPISTIKSAKKYIN